MRVWGLAVLLLVPAVVAGQSLGQVAQKEKKRREKNKEQAVKVRVIGEEEISRVPPGVGAAPVAENPEVQVTAPETTAEVESQRSSTSDRARQEREWRGRMSQARSRLESARKQYELLNGLSLNQGEYYVDEEGRPVITSLDQLRSMIREAKAALDEATKALDDLTEEARRAGVPPGWLR